VREIVRYGKTCYNFNIFVSQLHSLREASLNTTSLALVVGMAALLFSPAAAAGREIPVYPGARPVLLPDSLPMQCMPAPAADRHLFRRPMRSGSKQQAQSVRCCGDREHDVQITM
jgi:hypothetical protein